MKKAFTLAEVLITLGIIGIVAAMTLSTLMAKYQKKQTVIKLKQSYSILSQAFNAAIAENGDVENWGLESIYGTMDDPTAYYENFAKTYFLPYIKPVKDYGLNSFKNIGYNKIYFKSGVVDNVSMGRQQYIVALANGNIIGISLDGHCDNEDTDENGNWKCNSQWYNTILYIIDDINGMQKPNVIGKDIFVMSFNSNGFHFYQYGSTSNNRDWLMKACSKNSTENRMCGRLIELDGWEIKYSW